MAGQNRDRSMGVGFLTIARLNRAYRQRELSPVEVTKALFTRIAAHDGALHSFLRLTEELALREAAVAERELMAGEGGGGADGGAAARADARHPLCAEGHRRDRRHPDHRPFQTAPGLRADA